MNIDRALKIRGWMSPRELEFLAVIAAQSRYIIEAGCFEGRSTRAMADNTFGRIYAVDPWNCPIFENESGVIYSSNDTTRHVFHANLYDKIKDKTVIMVPKSFHYSDFDSIEQIWDFIFIDADHSYEAVQRDIHSALKLCPNIIAGHDYQKNWPGVIKAVDEAFPNSQKEDTIWWQKLR